MDIFTIREKYANVRVTDIPLKVVYYARVSTEKEEQLNALSNQLSYYEDYINSCPNWTFVRGYVDEGLSGVSTSKRENFNQMLDDASNKHFDLIITKEISRFARNTLDSIKFTRELLRKGVAVYFKEDNINTIDPDAELRLTIMASLAQDESRRISNRVRIGHNMAIKKGHVLGNSRIYGYTSCGAKLTIKEDEAEMVRLIYDLYANQGYGTRSIERELYEKGYRNRNGGAISRTVIGHIITNPKYKGWYCGNKVKVIDMFTKQQKFLPQEDWEMWKDETGETVPAIVDEELWEKANRIFNTRSKEVKLRSGKQNHNNLFTSKIQCANDGCNYIVKYRTLHGKKTSPTWTCSHKLKNGANLCSSFSIKEEALVWIVKDILSSLCNDYKDIVSKYLELYEKSLKNVSFEKDKIDIQNKISKLKKKQDNLIDLVTDGILDKETFKEKNDKIKQEIIELEKKNSEISVKESQQYINNKLANINYLKEYIYKLIGDVNSEEFNKAELNPKIIDALIQKIIIKPLDNYNAIIDVVLNSNNNNKNYSDIQYKLSKENREFKMFTLDNSFKKMIEEQEKQMANKES
jgi:recombinase